MARTSPVMRQHHSALSSNDLVRPVGQTLSHGVENRSEFQSRCRQRTRQMLPGGAQSSVESNRCYGLDPDVYANLAYSCKASESSASSSEFSVKMHTPTIDRTRRTEAGSRKPTARSLKAADFAEHLRAELPSPAGHAPELAPAASLSTILGAQEVEADGNERRGLAARYGADLLDRLAELRLNLLSGTLPAARLHALARALRVDRRPFGDPRIEIVVEEIELRVQVEIAKLANSYQPRRPTGIEASGESIFCTLSTG